MNGHCHQDRMLTRSSALRLAHSRCAILALASALQPWLDEVCIQRSCFDGETGIAAAAPISSSLLTDAPAFGCAANDAKQGQLRRNGENISSMKTGRGAADQSSRNGRWSAWVCGRAAPERQAPTPDGRSPCRDAANSSEDRLRFVLQQQALPRRSAHSYRLRGGGLVGTISGRLQRPWRRSELRWWAMSSGTGVGRDRTAGGFQRGQPTVLA